jgi:hypothetical protein
MSSMGDVAAAASFRKSDPGTIFVGLWYADRTNKYIYA